MINSAYWVILHTSLSSADFFIKILSGIPSECQTVWIQIRPDILSGLIWVQTVCKGYQQMTLVGNELSTIINSVLGLTKECWQKHYHNSIQSVYLSICSFGHNY